MSTKLITINSEKVKQSASSSDRRCSVSFNVFFSLLCSKSLPTGLFEPKAQCCESFLLSVYKLSFVFFQELGVDIKKEPTDQDSGFVDDESSEHLCGGYIWDPQGDYEQIEAFDYAVSSSCELGFEKVRNINSVLFTFTQNDLVSCHKLFMK